MFIPKNHVLCRLQKPVRETISTSVLFMSLMFFLGWGTICLVVSREVDGSRDFQFFGVPDDLFRSTRGLVNLCYFHSLSKMLAWM